MISHLPPAVLLGTLTAPVLLCAEKSFSLQRLPRTLPVVVSIAISAASLCCSRTSPVRFRISISPSISTFSRAMIPVLLSAESASPRTEVKLIFPVLVFTNIRFSQLRLCIVRFPVVVVRLICFAPEFSRLQFPVVRRTAISESVVAAQRTDAVVPSICIDSNVKSAGIAISPVSAYRPSRAFCHSCC